MTIFKIFVLQFQTAAYDYYYFAAKKGQIDSATMVAQYNTRGTPALPRDPEMAASYVQKNIQKKNLQFRYI